MVTSIIILLGGFLLIGVVFLARNYVRTHEGEDETLKIEEDEEKAFDKIIEEGQKKVVKEKKEKKEKRVTPKKVNPRRGIEEDMYDEVHKEGKLSVLRKKKDKVKIIGADSSDGANWKKKPSAGSLMKIDHGDWSKKFSKLLKELVNRGYKDTTPQKNTNSNYFCYNSPKKPWDRFHFQTYYSSKEGKMIVLTYFGSCVLGPGTVHGGAIMGMTLELMKIFLRVHGLEKMEMFENYGCMFMKPLPLETVHIIEVVHERIKKDGNYEIRAEIKSMEDESVVYFIGRGEFNVREGGMDVIKELEAEEEGEIEEDTPKRTALKGVEDMKRSFMELMKFENYKHVKNYRSLHKYLQYENHFLNHDQKEGMSMSNYFNFKVLSKVEDMEVVYFIFFGVKTEGEKRGFVHPSALIAIFDALAGLTPILMGYSDVKTNSLNISFTDSDILGSEIETLKLYKMVCRNIVVRKDVLKDTNIVRTKHKVNSSLRDITGFRVHANFTGVFIDHKSID